MSALYLNDGLRTPGLKTEAPNDTWPGCSFFLSNWDFYSLCLPANGRAANISSQHQLIVWNFILQNELMKKRCQDGVSGAKPLPIRWIVINSQPVGRHAERLAQSSPVVLVVSFCSMSDRFVCRQFKSFSFLTQKHTQARTHTHTHKSELINCTGDRELLFFLDARDKVEPFNRPQRIWNSRWRRDAKTLMEGKSNSKCQMLQDVEVDYPAICTCWWSCGDL